MTPDTVIKAQPAVVMATPATEASASSTTIKIGTRESALAMKQTHIVVAALEALHPTLTFSIHAVKTMGDKDQTTPLYNFGGKGLWTSELEAKLAGGDVDMIVHSLKDMPTTLPDGCVLGCVTRREDPRDVVVLKRGLVEREDAKMAGLKDLPAGAVIGTSSVRRIAQLRRIYPALEFQDVRGNIGTRLRKLDDEEGPFSAIILAAAGLLRMDQGARIAEHLESSTGGILHAVGQGALGIEAREGDERILSLIEGLQDEKTMLACAAERSLMRALEGGCSVPIGVETSWAGGKLKLAATVTNLDGINFADVCDEEEIKTEEEAATFGKRMAQGLVDSGADKILEAMKK